MTYRPAAALMLALLITAGCGSGDDTDRTAVAGRSPAAAVQGLDAAGGMHPGADDRCPVCAMTTHDRKMGSAIELNGGGTWYFCGTGCMMKAWLHPEIYLGAGDDTVRRAVTTEFFSGDQLDAAAVVWVAGSDVVGPMGPMIVPVADEAAAERFQERHGGKAVFRLPDLDDAMWESLTGKKVVPRG